MVFRALVEQIADWCRLKFCNLVRTSLSALRWLKIFPGRHLHSILTSPAGALRQRSCSLLCTTVYSVECQIYNYWHCCCAGLNGHKTSIRHNGHLISQIRWIFINGIVTSSIRLVSMSSSGCVCKRFGFVLLAFVKQTHLIVIQFVPHLLTLYDSCSMEPLESCWWLSLRFLLDIGED